MLIAADKACDDAIAKLFSCPLAVALLEAVGHQWPSVISGKVCYGGIVPIEKPTAI